MDDNTTHAHDTAFRVLVGLAAFALLVQGVSAARSYIEPLLLALLVAIALSPAVAFLTRRRVPAVLAVTLVMLGLTALAAGTGAVVFSALGDFSSNLPAYEAKLNAQAQATIDWLHGLHPALAHVEQLRNQVDPGMAMDLAGALLTGFGSLLSSGLLILVIVFFLLIEATALRAKVQRATHRGDGVLAQFDRISRSVNRYLAIKTVLSAVNGIAVGLWLWIAGVDYPAVWGLLMFLMNFVPGVGQPLALVPPLLLAWLGGGVETVILAGAGCLLINAVIGNWAEPKYLGEGLGLSTFVVILSLIVWGWVLGPVGMLLSVPLTMILKIVFEATPSTRPIAVMLGTGEEHDVPARGNDAPRGDNGGRRRKRRRGRGGANIPSSQPTREE